ncbi:NAD(P)-binding protein [Parathielavia appendiculata]|uniref:NAD(P)-binding protein n=1 Tax=Parathielavia appendiculata TaxID=2587402 RepID=A0AAN6TV04_9PEZI|nr:NAD(P)-binding protein [Parathielavia appendiculata]
MADRTTVLITGANRGIGRGLTEAYLSRPDHTVIAAVRDPSSATAQSLHSVPAAPRSKVHVIKIDSASDKDAAEAIRTVQDLGIRHLDVVIANAGIAEVFETVDQINPDKFRTLFEVNTLGPVKLFGAVFPLLKAAAEIKGVVKYAAIGTVAASTANVEANKATMLGSYGASKAALSHLVRRAQFENDWLTAVVVSPGWAQTDMGNAGARLFGMEKAVVPVKDSAEGIIKVLDNATRETAAGAGGFWEYDGTPLTY